MSDPRQIGIRVPKHIEDELAGLAGIVQPRTKFRFIHFRQSKAGVWYCYSNSDTGLELGFCEPHYPWHQWQFISAPEVAFTHECLRDIATFLQSLPRP